MITDECKLLLVNVNIPFENDELFNNEFVDQLFVVSVTSVWT